MIQHYYRKLCQRLFSTYTMSITKFLFWAKNIAFRTTVCIQICATETQVIYLFKNSQILATLEGTLRKLLSHDTNIWLYTTNQLYQSCRGCQIITNNSSYYRVGLYFTLSLQLRLAIGYPTVCVSVLTNIFFIFYFISLRKVHYKK